MAWARTRVPSRVTPKSSFSGHSQKPTKQHPSRQTCEMQWHQTRKFKNVASRDRSLLINWQRGEGGGKQRMDRDSAVAYANTCMARACDTKIKFSLWYLYFDSTWLHTAYGEFSSSIKCGYIIIGLGDSSPTSVHFLLIILLRFLDPHAFLPPSAYWNQILAGAKTD